MTPKLAPEARYRLIPHPTGVGVIAAILDEAEPLNEWRHNALNAWLSGPLHPAEYHSRGGGVTRYVADGRFVHVTSEQAQHLRLPMVAAVVASLGTMPHAKVANASTDRLFGLAADGTLIAAVAGHAAYCPCQEETVDAA